MKLESIWLFSNAGYMLKSGKSPRKICQQECFGGVFCLDHSKLEVVLQNCWISLMTDDFENLRKSEWVSYRTTHQQNESWSWKSSELHQDETSRYPRTTGGSWFIFSSKFKLIIPIFKSFKSDWTLKFAYSLKSSSIFNMFINARSQLARKTSVWKCKVLIYHWVCQFSTVS